jgi:hypothetical protein
MLTSSHSIISIEMLNDTKLKLPRELVEIKTLPVKFPASARFLIVFVPVI